MKLVSGGVPSPGPDNGGEGTHKMLLEQRLRVQTQWHPQYERDLQQVKALVSRSIFSLAVFSSSFSAYNHEKRENK